MYVGLRFQYIGDIVFHKKLLFMALLNFCELFSFPLIICWKLFWTRNHGSSNKWGHVMDALFCLVIIQCGGLSLKDIGEGWMINWPTVLLVTELLPFIRCCNTFVFIMLSVQR